MLKYLTKFAMEIIPSVIATILGAYIVNHYINAKPDAPPSTVAAMASAAYAKITGSKADAKGEAPKATAADGVKPDAKPAETSADISNIPAPGIKAKGVSEKSLSDKAAEKAVEVKPAETASLPAEAPPHKAPPREKLLARTAPAEAPAAQPEERRDAADLARAAIERLRASEGSGKAAAEKSSADKSSGELARGAGETSRIVTAAPPVSPVRPLPPPITVATPPVEQGAAAPSAPGANPSYTGSLQPDGRPTPPAEIPTRQLRPLDLRADRPDSSIKDQMSNVAQDMMSAAKSVFHSVLPK